MDSLLTVRDSLEAAAKAREASIGAASALAAIPWRTSKSVDSYTGETDHYAHSRFTGPDFPMGFPYHDTDTRLAYRRTKESGRPNEWVYRYFTDQPNLVRGEIGDGCNAYYKRVMWDENFSKITLFHDWGAEPLYVQRDSDAIENIKRHSAETVELDGYGENRPTFTYTLVGAANEIDKACGNCLAI